MKGLIKSLWRASVKIMQGWRIIHVQLRPPPTSTPWKSPPRRMEADSVYPKMGISSLRVVFFLTSWRCRVILTTHWYITTKMVLQMVASVNFFIFWLGGCSKCAYCAVWTATVCVPQHKSVYDTALHEYGRAKSYSSGPCWCFILKRITLNVPLCMSVWVTWDWNRQPTQRLSC